MRFGNTILLNQHFYLSIVIQLSTQTDQLQQLLNILLLKKQIIFMGPGITLSILSITFQLHFHSFYSVIYMNARFILKIIEPNGNSKSIYIYNVDLIIKR